MYVGLFRSGVDSHARLSHWRQCYIGSAVAERLDAAGHLVTGLAPSDAAASRLSAAGIQPVRGNFLEAKRINAAARVVYPVISMATTYDPDVDGPAIDAILSALAAATSR